MQSNDAVRNECAERTQQKSTASTAQTHNSGTAALDAHHRMQPDSRRRFPFLLDEKGVRHAPSTQAPHVPVPPPGIGPSPEPSHKGISTSGKGLKISKGVDV